MMKKRLFLSVIIYILTINSIQAQMEHDFINEGNSSFYKEYAGDFSESFRKEMITQLTRQFNRIVEVDGAFEKYYFGIQIGRDDPKWIEKDGYVFGLVQLLTPQSMVYTVTICWTSDDKTDLFGLRKKDVSSSDIQFNWCADFPKEEAKKLTKPQIHYSKGENGMAFDLDAYIRTFPDIYIKFTVAEPLTDTEKQQIRSVFEQYNTKSYKFYLSDFTDNALFIDYNGCDWETYTEKDYKKDMEELMGLFGEISKLPAARKINLVELF